MLEFWNDSTEIWKVANLSQLPQQAEHEVYRGLLRIESTRFSNSLQVRSRSRQHSDFQPVKPNSASTSSSLKNLPSALSPCTCEDLVHRYNFGEVGPCCIVRKPLHKFTRLVLDRRLCHTAIIQHVRLPIDRFCTFSGAARELKVGLGLDGDGDRVAADRDHLVA